MQIDFATLKSSTDSKPAASAIGNACLGVPLLENTKGTTFPFHVFHKYEIHIQDFEDCLGGSSSFPGARLPLFIFSKFKNLKMQSYKIPKCQGFEMSKFRIFEFFKFQSVKNKTKFHSFLSSTVQT